MEIKAPRGMPDVLLDETPRWQVLEARLREVARRYGYREIRTPVVEHTDVFQRGVGAGTDIVEKEMYTFEDRGGRSLSLRAEGTAPVMRAFLEHNLGARGLPVRLYYLCPVFRYDRPQAGRYRQHTQFGAELIGSPEPAADAEVLSLAVRALEHLGLKHVTVHLNSVGDAVCRPHYMEALRDYFRPHLGELCDDCRRRFEIAPLRLLDCKQERDRRIAQGAPRMLSFLCEPCRVHFEAVQAHLSVLEIPFVVDTSIVRGLDYYTRTAAEVFSGRLGAQNAMFGGGRYDGLAEQLGGKPTPGVGFGMGLERVLLVLEQEGIRLAGTSGPDVFIATAGAEARRAVALADRLRREGLAVVADVMARGLRAQMKEADRAGAAFVLLLGDEEIRRGVAVLREMATGQQDEVPLDRLPESVLSRVRRQAETRRA
jgi:histidyl-tRNA synthetase